MLSINSSISIFQSQTVEGLQSIGGVGDSNILSATEPKASLYVIVGSAYNAVQEYDNQAIQRLACKGPVYIVSIDIKDVPEGEENFHENVQLERHKRNINLKELAGEDKLFFEERFSEIRDKLTERGLSLDNLFVCDSVCEFEDHPAVSQLYELAGTIFNDGNAVLGKPNPISKKFRYVTITWGSSSSREKILTKQVAGFIEKKALDGLSEKFGSWVENRIFPGKSFPVSALLDVEDLKTTVAFKNIKEKECKSDEDRRFWDDLPKMICKSLAKEDVDTTLCSIFFPG